MLPGRRPAPTRAAATAAVVAAPGRSGAGRRPQRRPRSSEAWRRWGPRPRPRRPATMARRRQSRPRGDDAHHGAARHHGSSASHRRGRRGRCTTPSTSISTATPSVVRVPRLRGHNPRTSRRHVDREVREHDAHPAPAPRRPRRSSRPRRRHPRRRAPAPRADRRTALARAPVPCHGQLGAPDRGRRPRAARAVGGGRGRAPGASWSRFRPSSEVSRVMANAGRVGGR